MFAKKEKKEEQSEQGSVAGTAFSSFEESGAQAKPTDSSTEAARQRQIERHRERRDRGVAEKGLAVETIKRVSIRFPLLS